jgi:hypothetical protein
VKLSLLRADLNSWLANWTPLSLVGFQRLAEVISGVKFIDGLSEEDLKTEENSYEKEKEQDGSLAASRCVIHNY